MGSPSSPIARYLGSAVRTACAGITLVLASAPQPSRLAMAEGALGIVYFAALAILELLARWRLADYEAEVLKTQRLLHCHVRDHVAGTSRKDRREAARALRYLHLVGELRGPPPSDAGSARSQLAKHHGRARRSR